MSPQYHFYSLYSFSNPAFAARGEEEDGGGIKIRDQGKGTSFVYPENSTFRLVS